MSYTLINIGYGDISSSNRMFSGDTFIDDVNKANASGVLTSFSFRVHSSSTLNGLKMGTFPLSTKIVHDYENLGGGFVRGSWITVTGKNCEVAVNDALGAYFTSGSMILSKLNQFSYTEYVCYHADGFDGNSHVYSSQRYTAAMSAAGVTVPDAPTNVSATDNFSDKITITWTAGVGESGGHRVYRNGVDVSGIVAHGISSFDDTPPVGTYSYTVKAINDAGLSDASVADNGTRVSGATHAIKLFKHHFIPGLF